MWRHLKEDGVFSLGEKTGLRSDLKVLHSSKSGRLGAGEARQTRLP